ncbi:MAG: hypothetical protein ABIR80_00700, partial [Opitutaceae bacterium]
AREFVHSLKLAGQMEWKAYCKRLLPNLPAKPEDIPARAPRVYEGRGWISWGDWLGNGKVSAAARNYLPYLEAREFVRSLALTSRSDWNRYFARKIPNLAEPPTNLSRQPNRTYASTGWVGWSDWLGCEIAETFRSRPKSNRYREFVLAREFARNLNFAGSLEWERYAKGQLPDKPAKPADIPASPKNTYRDSWKGWGDWLGNGNVAPFKKQFCSFEEGRLFARTLGFKISSEWYAWARVPGNRPQNIPSSPAVTYKAQGWISWPDFLQPPT